MKRIIKKVIPFVLAVLIVFQTIYSSVQTAQASAIPEVLYYTYWDLINTIYATCGYDSKVDDSVVNNHGVTGKQAWSNFVTFVENSAKANYKFVGDGMSKAFSELENLVNTATEKGISMSQDLFDMLKDVFGYQVKYTGNQNQFDCSSVKSVNDFIKSLTGGGYLDSMRSESLVDGKALLNIIYDPYYPAYSVFIINKSNGIAYDYLKKRANHDFLSFYMLDNSGNKSECPVHGSWVRDGNTMLDVGCATAYPGFSWIIKNGAFVGTDVVSAQVSAGACPQEVPEVAPWRKSVDIPDEWRVINPNETPEQNPDDKPEVLPVIIPIHPTKPDTKPDTETTENPDTETTENPDKDPDKKKNPVVNPIINPDTGNVIDPSTGWDIDPSTGKLINPNTGELVDPDMSNPSSLTKKFGDITKLFPFCIPFDLVCLIRGMNAEKKPPVFHYEHKFKDINYTFVVDVDLSDYDKYIKLFRFGMQIFYIIALMFLTSKISNYFA